MSEFHKGLNEKKIERKESASDINLSPKKKNQSKNVHNLK